MNNFYYDKMCTGIKLQKLTKKISQKFEFLKNSKNTGTGTILLKNDITVNKKIY